MNSRVQRYQIRWVVIQLLAINMMNMPKTIERTMGLATHFAVYQIACLINKIAMFILKQ